MKQEIDFKKPLRHVNPKTKQVTLIGLQTSRDGKPITDGFDRLVLVGRANEPYFVNRFGEAMVKGALTPVFLPDEPVVEAPSPPLAGAAVNLDPVVRALSKIGDDLAETFSAVNDFGGDMAKIDDRLSTLVKHLTTVVNPKLDDVTSFGKSAEVHLGGIRRAVDDISTAASTSFKEIRDDLVTIKLEQKRYGQEATSRLTAVATSMERIPAQLNLTCSQLSQSFDGAQLGILRGIAASLAEDADQRKVWMHAVGQLFGEHLRKAVELRSAAAPAGPALSDIDRRVRALETDTRARLESVQVTLDSIKTGLDLLLEPEDWAATKESGKKPEGVSASRPATSTTDESPDFVALPPTAHVKPLAVVKNFQDLAKVRALPEALARDTVVPVESKITFTTTQGRPLDLGDELHQSITELASCRGVKKIQFGTSARMHPDPRRLGLIRYRKEVDGAGDTAFCARGYGRDGVIDLFIYCQDPIAKAAVLSTLQTEDRANGA